MGSRQWKKENGEEEKNEREKMEKGKKMNISLDIAQMSKSHSLHKCIVLI